MASYKAHTAKIMVGVMIMFMLISCVSAADLLEPSTWDNIKDVDYTKLVSDYPTITVKNSIAWIIPRDPILQTSITTNTPRCLNGICNTEQSFDNYKETSPIEDVRFIDSDGKEVEVPYTLYTYGTETYITQEKDKQTCVDTKNTWEDGTPMKSCSWTYKDVEATRQVKVPYKLGDENIGETIIGIDADISGLGFVDYQMKTNGLWLEEYVGWTEADCSADGGTITIDGDYCVHTFTSSGTFNLTSAETTEVDYLVVAGGGGGGWGRAGAGGAGGLLNETGYSVSVQKYNIYVGAGGAGSTLTTNKGVNGGVSGFDDNNATGGGGGGSNGVDDGANGGSGGGGAATATAAAGGTGVAGQGFAGGAGSAVTTGVAGGGGGASEVGEAGAASAGGDGGDGLLISINGTAVYYAGGGGGAVDDNSGADQTIGGLGGGGNGGNGITSADAEDGTDGLGGGGGGGGSGGTGSSDGGDGGDGVVIIRYEIPDPREANATSSYPEDYYNTTDRTPTLAGNFTGNIYNNITDVGVIVYNASGSQKYNFIETDVESPTLQNSYNRSFTTTSLTDGTYTWEVFMISTEGGTNASSGNRTFTIDATDPTVTIEVPSGDVTDTYVTANSRLMQLNFTATDTNLQTCWYNNGTGINNTVACGTNATFTQPYGTWTRIAYANDSFGNLGSDTETTTYSYNVFENSLTYTASVVEGTTDTFTLNVSADGLESITGTLYYNNTAQTTSKIGSNTEMRFVSTIAASDVGTIPVRFEVDYGGTIYNSTITNQNVSAFNFTNCNPGETIVFNFTIRDEDTQIALPAATVNLTFEVSLDATTTSGAAITSYNATVLNTNPIAICTPTTLSNIPIILDGLIRYEGNGTYISEFYTIQNYSLTNTSVSNNISLYDLTTARAQEFKITYKDASFLPVTDIVLDVQRNYIGDGVYRTVELPPFDNDGETLANLVLGDVIYTLIVKKDNQVLSTFNNIKAFCDNVGTGDCEINLNAFSSYVSPESYATVDDTSITMSYDEDTRTVTTLFSTTDGTSKTLLMNVTTYDLLGNETVCSDTLTSSSGTLSCVIPATFGNSSAQASLYIDGTKQAYKMINLWANGDTVFGYSTVTLQIISFLTIVGIALGSTPVVIILSIMIGIMANIGLGLTAGTLVGVGSSFLWLVIVLVTLLWKGNRRQD